jgi:glycosyltransferase involved in cell wall biosynthesis
MIKNLAVVDQVGNAGGGSRFIRCLLPALKQVSPDTEIVFFCNQSSIARDNLHHELTCAGITIRHLHANVIRNADLIYSLTSKIKLFTNKQPYFLSSFLMKLLRSEIETKISNFDLAFFPWPFLMLCPNLKCPMVATFHDFNFRYYFTGNFTFNPFQQFLLDQETPIWLKRSFPVVSTYFIDSELKKFYPDAAHQTEVIHLASLSVQNPVSDHEARVIVSNDLKIDGDYILYPTNTCAHKNTGPLIQAMSILKNMNHNIKLILTGPNTRRINGHSSEIGLELGTKTPDVIGLDYVSNAQMDALIQCARAVVSSSMYEAGNGPGLDAWVHAVPVAMSNIPPFIEHIEVQDVKAQVFDPRNPQDIANKIDAILSNPQKAKADALYSQQALKKITWKNVAEKYFNVFNKTIMEESK